MKIFFAHNPPPQKIIDIYRGKRIGYPIWQPREEGVAVVEAWGMWKRSSLERLGSKERISLWREVGGQRENELFELWHLKKHEIVSSNSHSGPSNLGEKFSEKVCFTYLFCRRDYAPFLV